MPFYILIFAYNDDASDMILSNLGTFNNGNITVLTPTNFIENCVFDDEEKKKLKSRLEFFDCSAINHEIFSVLSKMVKSISNS